MATQMSNKEESGISFKDLSGSWTLRNPIFSINWGGDIFLIGKQNKSILTSVPRNTLDQIRQIIFDWLDAFLLQTPPIYSGLYAKIKINLYIHKLEKNEKKLYNSKFSL